MINDIVNNPNKNYDIYKYVTDLNDNIYILYKEYEKENISFEEKRNTTGQLWIRLKDYPIAFPAFYGDYPIVDTSKNNINGNITLLSKEHITHNGEISHNTKKDVTQMSYFYDFEID
jgi:hypothetical protein